MRLEAFFSLLACIVLLIALLAGVRLAQEHLTDLLPVADNSSSY